MAKKEVSGQTRQGFRGKRMGAQAVRACSRVDRPGRPQLLQVEQVCYRFEPALGMLCAPAVVHHNRPVAMGTQVPSPWPRCHRWGWQGHGRGEGDVQAGSLRRRGEAGAKRGEGAAGLQQRSASRWGHAQNGGWAAGAAKPGVGAGEVGEEGAGSSCPTGEQG